MNLVFASGFLMPQRFLGQEYFRNVRATYPEACFPRVPVTGSIETRARALAVQISAFVFPEPRAPTHIIAHSMAGLDARLALHRNMSGLSTRVASLSTIGTPHSGTPIADVLLGERWRHSTMWRAMYRAFYRAAGALGISPDGLRDLTTGSARQFNEKHPDIAAIPCHCYAGTGADAYLLRLTSAYIRSVGQTADERDNDGLVSVASASWKPLAEPPWPADHIGQVGHSLVPPEFASRFAHLEALRRVVWRATSG